MSAIIKSVGIVLSTVLFICVTVYVLDSVVKPDKLDVRSYLHVCNEPRPLILSHRGSRHLLPENTLHAFKWAKKLGGDVLEFDVRLTSDGVMVVTHDPIVDRTTEGSVRVEDVTFDTLRKLDAGYGFTPKQNKSRDQDVSVFPFRGLDHRMPTLAEVLDAFPGTPKNIEIKENTQDVAKVLWTVLQQFPYQMDHVAVASQWCEVLHYFREISFHMVSTTACEQESILFVLLSKLRLYNIYAYLSKPEAEGFQLPYEHAGMTIATKELVESAHRVGQKVMFWVANSPEVINNILDTGADAIVTDRTDIAYKVFKERGYTMPDLEDTEKFKNTPEGYFIPEYTSEEISSCRTFMCTIAENQVLSVAITGLVLVLIVYTCISSGKSDNQAIKTE